MEKKEGVFLKAKINGLDTFADYFPNIPFGDQGCDYFLTKFNSQSDTYTKKVLHLLLKDREYQKIPSVKFKNHQLWTGVEDFETDIIKYKLIRPDDRLFMDPLLRGMKIRLDANAMFNRQSFLDFVSSLPQQYLKQIEYVEDPIVDESWENLPLPVAKDVTTGTPHDFYIHRPNSGFFPEQESKVIFSSYLGHDLGSWHTYCELAEKADLSLIHGIISKGFFQEEKFFYDGNYESGFKPNTEKVKNLYTELSKLNWNKLCEI
jgi:hypothetical protein